MCELWGRHELGNCDPEHNNTLILTWTSLLLLPYLLGHSHTKRYYTMDNIVIQLRSEEHNYWKVTVNISVVKERGVLDN